MWQTRGLVGRAPLPSARFRISLNNAQKIRRTRGTPGSFHICKCSSPQLSPSPVASSPINDNDNEDADADADATTPQTTALPTATEPGDIAANAAAEVNTVDREIVDEEDITEAVTSSKQRGTQAASQNQSVDPQDNVLSVGFGERVILLDKSKVMALGKKALFVFLGVTFSIAMFRTLLKYMSPKATRVRTVGKNREVVEELMKYLPNNRDALSGQVLWMLRLKTGFTSIEVFRKYLWFTLREKEFGQEAVDDLVYLKTALGMNEHEIGEALKERAERIYDKYGTLMLNTVGMSSSGIERKATCKALFSKMLYLTEYEPLLGADSEALEKVDLREIFGATEADVDRLRIPSIQDLDWNKLDEMASEDTDKPTVAND